jgi:hypothetical protein
LHGRAARGRCRSGGRGGVTGVVSGVLCVRDRREREETEAE